MPQKANMKKGFMDEADILEHIKELGGQAQIGYLKQVLKKKGLLRKATQMNVQLMLAKAYDINGFEKNAARTYKEMGGKFFDEGLKVLRKNKMYSEAGEMLESEGRYLEAAEIYKEGVKIDPNDLASGNLLDRDVHLLKRAANAFETGNEPHKAAGIYAILAKADSDYKKRAGELYESTGELRKALRFIESHGHRGKLYEKLSQNDSDRNHRIEDLKMAIGNYERDGDGIKVARLQKRLQKLTDSGKNVESTLLITGILGLGGIVSSLIFVSPSVTGNSVFHLTSTSSSMIGIPLLIIGAIAGFFFLEQVL